MNRLGARAATGERLRFTDAEVVMAPFTLGHAVAHLQRRGLDPPTAAPETAMPGPLKSHANVA